MPHYDEKREDVRYGLDTPIVYAFQDSDRFNPDRCEILSDRHQINLSISK